MTTDETIDGITIRATTRDTGISRVGELVENDGAVGEVARVGPSGVDIERKDVGPDRSFKTVEERLIMRTATTGLSLEEVGKRMLAAVEQVRDRR